MDYRPFALIFNSKGLDLRDAPDQIPVESFYNFSNLTSDREGSVRTRMGRVALNTTPIPAGNLHTLAKIYNPTPYRYVGGDKDLFRAASPFTTYSQILPGPAAKRSTYYKVGDVVTPELADVNGHCYVATVAGTTGGGDPVWPTGTGSTVTDGGVTWKESNFSGNPMLTAAYNPGISLVPYMFFADPNLMIKDSGTGSPTLWGIVAPDIAPTVVTQAQAVTLIEDFQSATPNAYWIKTDPGAVCTLTRDSGVYIGPNGNNSLSCNFSAVTAVVFITKTFGSFLDLTLVGGLPATDADLIHIFINVSDIAQITGITLELSIVDNTFTNFFQTTIGPTQLVGSNVWSDVQVARGEFEFTAGTLSTPDWSKVKAMRIAFNVKAAIQIWFDDWNLEGGSNLSGSNYTWISVFRNSSTGEISGGSPASAVPADPPNRQNVAVTVETSQDPQVDFIDVYRIGGTTTSYSFSGSVANDATMGSVVYTDNVPDVNLGAELQPDIHRPPNSVGTAFHLNRLWTWGAAGDAANQLRFSRNVDVEEFQTNSFIPVGDSSEKIVLVVSFDEQSLFVFTLNDVYRVIGTDETSFIAMKTSYGRGMINNALAACVTPSRIYHTHYDGIYEFPSGRKVTQPIDGVFHGLVVNGIVPINTALLSDIRLAFYDNKLHVDYSASSENDAEMVFDTIYERWNQSTQSGQSLLYEKDIAILTMGVADGFVYQIETGTTDNSAPIPFELRTGFQYLNLPDQDKIWGDLALDIDTRGQTVAVQSVFNNGDIVDTIYTVSCNGRKQLQVPINNGDSILAINAQLVLSGSTLSQVTIWKAIYRVLIEPPRRRTYVTDWSDDGKPGRKQYRTIALEIDTLGGAGVIVQLQVDSVAVQTFPTIQTAGRQVIYLGINTDTVGTMSRLKFTQAVDSPTAVFKLYNHNIETIPQPDNPSIWQTDWSDEGYPYDKYWKEVLLQVDTGGGNRTVQLQVSNGTAAPPITASTFTINTTSRQWVTQSVTDDIIAKLARIIITGGPVSFYAIKYIVDKEPPDTTFVDTYELTMGNDRYKQLKRMWLALKAPAPISWTIYGDNIVRATGTITIADPTVGWQKILVQFPPGVKGKLIRLTLASAAAFKIYWQQSEIEWRAMSTTNGYQRYKFEPPQLM